MNSPGDIIGDKYLLEEQIGEGGMASVWRAVHTTLQRPVAIKFVYLEGRNVEARRERFLREAQLAASIRHRCVVDIVDFGHTDDDQPFMIMELLEGETLGERFERGPRLAVDETVQIFDMLLGGLAAIHDRGIVHRDLKPDNIFLTQDGDGLMPKLTDFGISRVASRESQRPPGMRRKAAITSPGMVLGTPDYMSPEQARGRAEIDLRSDVFSIGVLLYEALSGVRPFDAPSTAELIAQIITDDPAPLTEYGVDKSLAEVVQMALAKDPDKRLQSARELRMAMRSATRLTAADLNDSKVLAGPSPRSFVPLPIAPMAAMAAISRPHSAPSHPVRLPAQNSTSRTADTVSHVPPAPTAGKSPAGLGVFVVVAVLVAVAAIAAFVLR